jgi:tRNA(Arg) A34 adenosine deaminase TadA
MSSTTEGVVLVEESLQKPALTATVPQITKMLAVMEEQIIPVTEAGVAKGNKVFGAAVLDKDLNLVLAGTNSETECPLFHGEVKVIYEWSKMTPAAERGAAAQSAVFFATHEPCCMCVSSILWSGFPQIFYFFSYSITSAQGIPHDINTVRWLAVLFATLVKGGPTSHIRLPNNRCTNSGASTPIARRTNTLRLPV